MDRVVKYINKTENLYDALVEYEKARGYDSDAEEEVIARCCESFLANRIFVQSFAKKNYKSAKAISEFLTQMNTDMRRVFDDAELRATEKGIYNDMSPEQEILSQVADIDDIARLWSNAVNALEKKRTEIQKAEGSVRMSFMDSVSLDQNVETILKMSDSDALQMKEDGRFVNVMDDTPSVITDNVKDAKNLPVVMRFDAAYLAIRHEGILEGHYHNYGASFGRIVRRILNKPDAILRLGNGRLNLLGSVVHKKGNTSIVSAELNTIQNVDDKYDYYNSKCR